MSTGLPGRVGLGKANLKRIFNWRETKWWYIGTVIAVLIGLCASLFLPTLNVKASNDFVSIDVGLDISATLKPPEQPFRNQSQAITVTTLGTNSDKAATSPWTALTGKSLTAGDYVFVMEAADSGTSSVSATVDKDTQTSYALALSNVYGSYHFLEAFVASSAYSLTDISFYGAKTGTPSGNLVINVYLADVNHKPTGSLLTTGNTVASSIVTGWNKITLNPYTLSASTEYVVIFSVSSGDASNYIKLYSSDTDILATWHLGTSSDSGSTWTIDPVSYDYSLICHSSIYLTADATGNNATNVVCKIWSGKIVLTSTAYYIVITNTSTAKAMTAIKASGLVGTSALDASNNATGSGTDASTGATGTLAQADELIVAVSGVEDEVDDGHGTWSGITGNEQFAATNDGGDASNIQCHSVAMVVSATTTKTGTDAGHDSNDWAGAVATYKMASSDTYDFTLDVNSKAFGVVANSTTYWSKGSAPSNPIQDGECTFILTSTGSAATDIDAHAHNFTGGVGWTIGAPGENQARLSIGVSGTDPAAALVLTTSDQELKDNLAAGGHFHFDIKMETPTSVTDGVQKSTTITLTGRAHS